MTKNKQMVKKPPKQKAKAKASKPKAKKVAKPKRSAAEVQAGKRYRRKHRLVNFYITPKEKAKIAALCKKLTKGNRAAWFRRVIATARV